MVTYMQRPQNSKALSMLGLAVQTKSFSPQALPVLYLALTLGTVTLAQSGIAGPVLSIVGSYAYLSATRKGERPPLDDSGCNRLFLHLWSKVYPIFSGDLLAFVPQLSMFVKRKSDHR